MKVAILGFARQGIGAYNYFVRQGAEVTICDQKTELESMPAGAKTRLGEDHLKNLADFDLLVRTPILKPEAIVAANPAEPDILSRTTTASNEFFKAVKTPIIAVTGTKGKGTTCLVSKAILEAAGLKVCLVGNIGISPLAVVEQAQAADVVVFEIASFQSLDLIHSPNVGVCLKISPEHLDWHKDFDDYIQAKAQLFGHQQPADKAIFALGNPGAEKAVSQTQATKLSYNPNDDAAYAHIKAGQIYVDGQVVAKTSDIRLLGQHNWENVCAALAAVYDFLPEGSAHEAITKGLESCAGFPNRLETIAQVNQVTYINDSYASAPEASIAALEAINGPKILIAGGHDKGVAMGGFVSKILSSNVKHLVTIGKTGPRIAELVLKSRPDMSLSQNLTTMPEIVSEAAAHAQAGDTVLLSTACASFGLFKNVDDRAEQFKQAVAQLAAK